MKRLVLLADDFAPDRLCPLHDLWGTELTVNGATVTQCPGGGSPHLFTWVMVE